MKGMIDETEIARLEELAGKASKMPFFPDGYDVQDDFDQIVCRCNGVNDLAEDVQEANTHYIAAACNSVPALVAEVRRLREALNKEHRAWQCADARGDGLEMENAVLREKVEAWEWYGECFDNCKQRGKLPLEVHKTPSAYSEAWASLWAAREAIHADRE